MPLQIIDKKHNQVSIVDNLSKNNCFVHYQLSHFSLCITDEREVQIGQDNLCDIENASSIQYKEIICFRALMMAAENIEK